MKLALCILVVCLVTISSQERVSPFSRQARAHVVPLFYANGLPAGYDIIDHNKDQQSLGRNNEKPLNRLLSNILPALITTTSTVTSTVASVVSTATFVNCLPVAQFVSTNATAACARRRRSAPEVLDLIQPAAPQPLEPTAIVEIPESKAIEHEPAEILSSKSDELAMRSYGDVEIRRFSTVKLVTVFTTTYSFVPTTITSTKSVVSDGALACLPAGYIVCK